MAQLPELVRSGLIGREIQASQSPRLHETAAAALGFQLEYELFDFAARGWSDNELERVLAQIVSEGRAGCNVTFPFKQAIMPLLDAVSPLAARVGAVNTIVIRDGKTVGHNTDLLGFVDSFQREMANERRDCALLLGAGGAGSAVAHGLAACDVKSLLIFDVDDARAKALAADIKLAGNPEIDVAAVRIEDCDFQNIDGVVNATPIGMSAYSGSPLAESLLSSRHWVMDIIYFPLETVLLSSARAKGCRVSNGVGMVVKQAALAFELITGRTPSFDRMKQEFADGNAPSSNQLPSKVLPATVSDGLARGLQM